MKVKSIILYLGNLDVIEFNGKYVGDILINGIYEQISRVSLNSVLHLNCCSEFFLEVHKDGNEEYNELGMEEYKTLKFDRIKKYNDITQVEIQLLDEDDEVKTFSYHLDYNDEDGGYKNLNQKTYVSSLGHLYISVKSDNKEKEIKDIFGLEFDDPEIMDFHFFDYNYQKEYNLESTN